MNVLTAASSDAANASFFIDGLNGPRGRSGRRVQATGAHALIASTPSSPPAGPMTRRDVIVVLGTLVVAVGLSDPVRRRGRDGTPPRLPSRRRDRVFFRPAHRPSARRSIVDAQLRVAGPLQAIVPLQEASPTPRATRPASSRLTPADRIDARSRERSGRRGLSRIAGGWLIAGARSHSRIHRSRPALSTAALAWVVFLSFVTGALRDAPFGAPVALQIGLTVFAVVCARAPSAARRFSPPPHGGW